MGSPCRVETSGLGGINGGRRAAKATAVVTEKAGARRGGDGASGRRRRGDGGGIASEEGERRPTDMSWISAPWKTEGIGECLDFLAHEPISSTV